MKQLKDDMDTAPRARLVCLNRVHRSVQLQVRMQFMHGWHGCTHVVDMTVPTAPTCVIMSTSWSAKRLQTKSVGTPFTLCQCACAQHSVCNSGNSQGRLEGEEGACCVQSCMYYLTAYRPSHFQHSAYPSLRCTYCCMGQSILALPVIRIDM